VTPTNGIVIFNIDGPVFFGAAEKLERTLEHEDQLIIVSTAWHILNEASIEFDVLHRLLPGVHPHPCGSIRVSLRAPG
jgi:hypothetical protein